MSDYCCVPACPRPANLVCYNIPKDSTTREKWLNSINSDPTAPSITLAEQDNASVCSLHFKPSDFTYLFDNETSKREIKQEVIPSVFPWTIDWDSNFNAEMEVVSLSNNYTLPSKPQKTLTGMDLPEGEAVELGNVESLGIGSQILFQSPVDSTVSDINCSNTERQEDPLTIPQRTQVMQANIQESSSTNPSSRTESSDEEAINKSSFTTLNLTYNYSCVDCDYKSTNPINLRDHRIKEHPPKCESVVNVNNSNAEFRSETRTSEIPTQQSQNSAGKKSRNALFYKVYVKRHNRNYYFCTKCTEKTTSRVQAFEHHRKKHPENDPKSVLNQLKNSTSVRSDSSASHPSEKPKIRRRPRNIYPCKKCSFKTPNAKNLRTHYKHRHSMSVPLTEIRTPSPDLHSTILEIQLSNIKSCREHGCIIYLCPTCPYKGKSTSRVAEHFRKTHMSNISPPASAEPKIEQENLVENHRCLICYFETTSEELLGKHLKERHSGDEFLESGDSNKTRIFCRLCFYSTDRKSSMKDHEQLHKIKSPFQCNICSYSVTSLRRLEGHLTHHHRNAFSCESCEFKADTKPKLKNHVDSVHKAGTNSTASAREDSQAEVDIEHACSHCSFRTPLRELFAVHEKTHLQNVGDSSTDELSIPTDCKSIKSEKEDSCPKSPKRKKRKRTEPSETSNSSESEKLVERTVYECTFCNYWVRSVNHFHQHLVAHEKTPAFRCSECDYTARYRTGITKHIQKSPKATHEMACWVMIKSLPEDHYAKYRKKALVPIGAYSGRSSVQTSATSATSASSESIKSFVLGNDSDGSKEWLPSSSASSVDMGDFLSESSPSYALTPESSTDYEEKPTSPSFVLTSSDSKSEVDRKSVKTESESPVPTTSKEKIKIEPKSPKKVSRPRRKKMRISSDEESDRPNHVTLPETPQLDRESGTVALIELSKSNKMELENAPVFPSIEDALAQRQKDEQKLYEKQQSIDRMRSRLNAMEEADQLSGSELLQLVERKKMVLNRLTKLNSQKNKAELEVRMQQCEVLKLSLMSSESDGEESLVDENAIAESKRQVTELEAKLNECCKEIVNVQEELKDVERQVKEAEESRAGAAQLVGIIRSELEDEENEFCSLKEQLASSSTQMKELVMKQRKHIAAQTAMWEAELKMAYDRARAKIRERERDWMDALNKYVGQNDDESLIHTDEL